MYSAQDLRKVVNIYQITRRHIPEDSNADSGTKVRVFVISEATLKKCLNLNEIYVCGDKAHPNRLKCGHTQEGSQYKFVPKCLQ
jgi:hypothetical protein